jgi:hypothetical protein
MPKPKKGMSHDEYVLGYCPNYIKKHEKSKANWDKKRLIVHCEGLWNEYKNKSNSDLVNELNKEGYKPISFTSNNIGIVRMDDGIIQMSEIKEELVQDDTDKEKIRTYKVVDAVAAVGDMFYGHIFVPSGVLKATAHLWNKTYNDISHLGTAFPAGLDKTENLEYITGFNSDAFFDESINGIRVKMHINKDAPKYKVWENFMNIAKDAKRIPNVSIFSFSRFKAIKKGDLPSGIRIPKGAEFNGYVIAVAHMIPIAVTTCIKGKCGDSAGCGISTGFTEKGSKCNCDKGYCDVSDSDDEELENERKEYLKKRIKNLKS